MDLRMAEIGIAKVASHMEDVGVEAVSANFSHLIDIIGNALADEAAALAAKALRPSVEAGIRARFVE